MTEASPNADSPRVALSVIGWLVSWAYVLAFVPVFATTATQYSDDAWVVSLLAAIVIGGFSLALIYLGGGHPTWTRWLVLPHILILFIGLGVIYQALYGATMAGHHLAAIALGAPEQTDIATPVWHRLYGVVHVAFFSSAAFLAMRPATHQATSATSIHTLSA
jgi:hypothetical protein